MALDAVGHICASSNVARGDYWWEGPQVGGFPHQCDGGSGCRVGALLEA